MPPRREPGVPPLISLSTSGSTGRTSPSKSSERRTYSNSMATTEVGSRSASYRGSQGFGRASVDQGDASHTTASNAGIGLRSSSNGVTPSGSGRISSNSGDRSGSTKNYPSVNRGSAESGTTISRMGTGSSTQGGSGKWLQRIYDDFQPLTQRLRFFRGRKSTCHQSDACVFVRARAFNYVLLIEQNGGLFASSTAHLPCLEAHFQIAKFIPFSACSSKMHGLLTLVTSASIIPTTTVVFLFLFRPLIVGRGL